MRGMGSTAPRGRLGAGRCQCRLPGRAARRHRARTRRVRGHAAHARRGVGARSLTPATAHAPEPSTSAPGRTAMDPAAPAEDDPGRPDGLQPLLVRACLVHGHQAWQRVGGAWTVQRHFRSTIGRNGWGKQVEGDMRSPNGVYRVKVTFSTTRHAPGRMPWRQRKPTSVVSAAPGATTTPGSSSAGAPTGRDRRCATGSSSTSTRPASSVRRPETRGGQGQRDLLPHLTARSGVGADRGLHADR